MAVVLRHMTTGRGRHEGLRPCWQFLASSSRIIKSFLGENLIEKLLAHRQALAASASERERVNLEADVKVPGL